MKNAICAKHCAHLQISSRQRQIFLSLHAFNQFINLNIFYSIFFPSLYGRFQTMLPFGDCDYYDKSDAKEHIYTFHPRKKRGTKKIDWQKEQEAAHTGEI